MYITSPRALFSVAERSHAAGRTDRVHTSESRITSMVAPPRCGRARAAGAHVFGSDVAVLGRVPLQGHRFPNRSRLIESALIEKLERIERVRLARECMKLDPAEERAPADEGLSENAGESPTY
jgi:hypothetical protein